MASKKPPPIDAKRLIWSSDWFVNDVELPMELPAPVSNNELTRRAAKLIRKHAGGAARGGEADRLVLYWSLRESALLVHGGDSVKIILKGSYMLSPEELALGAPAVGAAAPAEPPKRAMSLFARKDSRAGGGGGSSASAATTPAAASARGRSGSCDLRRLGAAQQTVRFFTRERRIYVPQQPSGMTATLKHATAGGAPALHYDCHQAGEYAIEVEEEAGSGTGLGKSGGAAGRSCYRLVGLAVRLEMAELRGELASLSVSAAGGGGDGAARSPTLMLEMVRNLDTGEMIHMSEIDERISAGTQPAVLRPLARPPKQTSFLASLFGLGPSFVELEPCLQPLPLLSIAGAMHHGSSLRLLVARDRFRVGDGLARGLAAAVREVTWRRQRCASEAGLVVKRGAADAAYQPCADDVGCMLSVRWASADGFELRADTTHLGVQPGLRDTISSYVAAAKASFDVTFVKSLTLTRGAAPTAMPTPDSKAAVAGVPSPWSGASAAHRATVRIDGGAKVVEVTARSDAIALRRSRTKPLSKHTRLVLDGSEPTLFLLQISGRRAYVLAAASSWERDLIALTLRAFLDEFPPADTPPTPLLLEAVTVDVVPPLRPEPDGVSERSDGSPPPPATPEPLSAPPVLHSSLRAVVPRAVHASGVEVAWYRTARNGVRTLVPGSFSSAYSPTADDLGCVLAVEAIPYADADAASAPSAADGRLSPPPSHAGSSDSDDSDAGSVAGAYAGALDAPVRPRLWGKPSHFRAAHEVQLGGAYEARLQRLCARRAAEFRIMAPPAKGRPPRALTLALGPSELQLRSGWSVELRWGYTEHMAATIPHWAASDVLVSLDLAAPPDGENTIRCACESVGERDLLVLVLRYLVAEACY